MKYDLNWGECDRTLKPDVTPVSKMSEGEILGHTHLTVTQL